MRSVLVSRVALVGVALATIVVGCTIVASGPGTPGYVSSGSATMEVNVDRPGYDYRNFDLASGRPEECRDTCVTEPQCLAFTFVNPGVQGPSARCWLKSSVPQATPSNCCISGVKNAQPAQASAGYESAPPPAEPTTAYVAPPPPVPTTAYVAPPPPAGERRGLEPGVDRPGSDIANFDLPQPRPHLCREACMRDGRCQAFTYVNPGVQGPSARCWLKGSVPNPVQSACCTSGVKGEGRVPAPMSGAGFEPNVDRPGYDFQNFDLPQPNPQLCRDACMREGQCRAFTYVNPGVQGPSARCWLKMSVPQATPSNCCISGVK
jgi:1-phosphatidylinositol phosphodiesterase